MPTILIADSCKPSLVMSSEVFKDKISGSTILIANNGKECLEIMEKEKPDMCVVDFDLPDTDGVTLIHALRKTYKGPILLTAFPDKIVKEAVADNLFIYNDSGAWIKKPVRFDDLAEKIDQFLLDKHRLVKRFDMEIETLIVGKGAGRGKRAPKVAGKIINLSMGGVCIELDELMKMKKDEELTVSMAMPKAESKVKTSTTAKSKTTIKATKKKTDTAEVKLKCSLAWIDRKNLKAGFAFQKLSDIQKRGIENLLRDSSIEE